MAWLCTALELSGKFRDGGLCVLEHRLHLESSNCCQIRDNSMGMNTVTIPDRIRDGDKGALQSTLRRLFNLVGGGMWLGQAFNLVY
jgi:hypothetical protein